MAVSAEARALGTFRELRQKVADIDARILRVVEYRDSLVAKRDRKAGQIALSEREERMWENKIAGADGTIAALTAEKRALLDPRESAS